MSEAIDFMSHRDGSFFEKGVRLLIQQSFKEWTKFKVIEETHKYANSVKDSSYLFDQKAGRLPKVCEVWLGNHYVCDVYESESPESALKRIMQGLAVLNKSLEERTLRKAAHE